ncbi:hypothetical protein D3C77_498650 [compost metagenome]
MSFEQFIVADLEYVTIEDDQVGLLAGGQRTNLLIQAQSLGGIEGVGLEHQLAIYTFFGVEHPQRSFAGAGLGDGVPRVGAGHRPVTGAGNRRTGLLQGVRRVLVAVGRRADVGLDQLDGVVFTRGPQHLHGRDHPQLLEAWKILGVNHLQVADTVHLV